MNDPSNTPTFSRRFLTATMAVCALMSFVGSAFMSSASIQEEAHAETVPAGVLVDAVPLSRLTLAPLVKRAAPAVVNIAVLQASPYL